MYYQTHRFPFNNLAARRLQEQKQSLNAKKVKQQIQNLLSTPSSVS